MSAPSDPIRCGASQVPTFETGVFLAINAIENSLLVMNSPRCPFVRGMKVFAHNDLASSAFSPAGQHRVITQEWTRFEDVAGREAPFVETLAELAARHPNHWIFSFQNISSLVAGFDLAGLTRQAGKTAGPRLVALDGPRLGQDHLAGYDEVLAQVLAHALDPAGEPRELLIVGHGFWRNEADETANRAELRRLLARLGLERAQLWLSGGALGLERLRPARVARMPYAGQRSQAALAAAGFETPQLGLPLGIEGTAGWLRRLGQALDRAEQAEACLAAEQQALWSEIGWIVREHLRGRSAALVADAPLGAALAGFLSELGMRVEALFCLSSPAPQLEAPVFEQPTAEEFCEFLGRQPVDLVIGGSQFKHLTRTGDAPALPYLELGFPSYTRHVLHPQPYLGFAGARWLVEAIFNALLERDEGHADRG